MEKEIFEKRVCEELGEGINPAYIEELLKKGVPEFIQWLHNSLKDVQPTVLETLHYACQYESPENDHLKSTLLLGTRILESRFKIILLVLKEIRSRIEATQISAKENKYPTKLDTS